MTRKSRADRASILDKELPLAHQTGFSSTELFLAPQSNTAHQQVVLYRKHRRLVYMQYESPLLITPQVREQQ